MDSPKWQISHSLNFSQNSCYILRMEDNSIVLLLGATAPMLGLGPSFCLLIEYTVGRSP
jgi:hypothetical protein